MKIGTLKELNVKPGDVVTLDGWSEQVPMVIGPDMVARSADNYYTMQVEYSTDPEWRIISRASQPTPDLTAITTPFGLLDEATQEALRAHGGPYEWFWNGHWVKCAYHNGSWDVDFTYRVKPGPITGTENMTIVNADGMELARATVNTYNGTPNWATLQVKLND